MKVLVISSVSSQLNYLVSGLARQEHLLAYVHSFLSTGGWWEKALSRSPIIGPKATKELGRRLMPEGLAMEQVVQPVVALEFAIAAIARVRPTRLRRDLSYRLMDLRGRALSQCGAELVRDADAVVAFHDTALEVFEQAGRTGALRVLDFPSAHPRFTDQLVREEAGLQPRFASSLIVDRPDYHVHRMEQEISLADLVLVPSTYVSHSFSLSGVPSDKLVTIPYGANVTRFDTHRGESEEGGFRVLFAGRIEQLKGLSYLLEGYQDFHRHDTTLVMAGALPPDSTVLEPYKDLFHHAGHLHPSAMPGFYQTGSVLVLPSLVEGWGFVVLEAMASGLPVIVTNTGAGDIVRDGVDGFVIPIRDAAAISECLNTLYWDPVLRREMGNSARQRAMEFTWDRYSSAVVDFLVSAT